MMSSRVVSVVLTGLLLTGCAATTPPPRYSAVSPADPEAPEAATPPPAPALAGETEPEVPGPAGEAAKPAPGHEGHSMPAAPGPSDEAYSCPMHPEVRQASPGSCPKCGMTLVERNDTRQQP